MGKKTYLLLLRGINVGGKNKIAMAALREHLEQLGFADVSTYIASGNVILRSDKTPTDIASLVESTLPDAFKLDSDLVRVLVLTRSQLQKVIENKPEGFGEQPDTYHSDAIFLIDIKIADAMKMFNPREGVDAIWPGDGVVYSQRLSAERTKSRLGTITQSRHYKSLTIRSWNTTTKLWDLMNDVDSNAQADSD